MQANIMAKAGLLIAALVSASPLWAQPYGYAVNSDGLNVPDAEIDNLYRINLATGEAERIGPTGFMDIEGLSFSSSGKLMGADDESNTLLEIDTFSGTARAVGGFNGNLRLPANQVLDFGLSFTCDALYASSDNLNTLYRINPDSGEATLVGSTVIPITGLASSGNVLYGIGAGELAPSLYRIDTETAATEFIGALGPEVAPYVDAGMSFDDDGNLWAITDRRNVGGESSPSQILMIDPQTGRATLMAETLIGIEALAIAMPHGCDTDGGVILPQAAAVPALNGAGLAFTILLLFAYGSFRLRRRT